VTSFDAEQLRSLLAELSSRLEERGVKGEMFLVGGAAMALVYSRRRATADIDAVFEPKSVIYEVAADMARLHGLDEGWLNDGVKGFLPGPDAQAGALLDLPGLAVAVASPRYLFAMKVFAARVDRDIDDLGTLYRLSKFQSLDEALGYVAELYGSRPIAPRSEYVVREALAAEELSHRGPKGPSLGI
jgi:hypothetical protein